MFTGTDSMNLITAYDKDTTNGKNMFVNYNKVSDGENLHMKIIVTIDEMVTENIGVFDLIISERHKVDNDFLSIEGHNFVFRGGCFLL